MKYRVSCALMTARFDFQKLEISQALETNLIFLIRISRIVNTLVLGLTEAIAHEKPDALPGQNQT